MPRHAANTQNRTVAIRKTNRDLRTREYLTPGEVKELMQAARRKRHGHPSKHWSAVSIGP